MTGSEIRTCVFTNTNRGEGRSEVDQVCTRRAMTDRNIRHALGRDRLGQSSFGELAWTDAAMASRVEGLAPGLRIVEAIEKCLKRAGVE